MSVALENPFKLDLAGGEVMLKTVFVFLSCFLAASVACGDILIDDDFDNPMSFLAC